MDVTYEWKVTWIFNLHHCVCNEQGHLLLGKFFPVSPSSPCIATKSVKKLITYGSFDVMQTNGINHLYFSPMQRDKASLE